MTSCLLIDMYRGVIKLGLFDIFIINATLFTNMISIYWMISIYLTFISYGIAVLVATADDESLLVLLNFRCLKLVPKIYSSDMMLSLVTRKFGSWFLLTNRR